MKVFDGGAVAREAAADHDLEEHVTGGLRFFAQHRLVRLRVRRKAKQFHSANAWNASIEGTRVAYLYPMQYNRP